MAKQFRVISYFSSVPHMLNEADFLIGLAHAQDGKGDSHERTLAASVAVLLAVCLDQGTLTVLDLQIQTAKVIKTPQKTAMFTELAKESLRRRVIRLPEVLTNFKFQLDNRNPQVRDIHDLITLRNELLHISEEANLSDSNGDIIESEDAHKVTIQLPAPQITNRWLFVDLENVQKYREAVGLYVSEVLFPTKRICKGKIVVQKVQGPR